MKAITYRRYGPPSVLSVSDRPIPKLQSGQVLVRVHASSVTTADWRIRAAAFPGLLQIPGRLMFGVFGPRKQITGMDFAGEVVEIASDVTGFKPGDRVFGNVTSGAHAEYVAISQSAALVPLPADMTFEQAAALPFGGLSALVFLRDFAKVQPGHKVLVIGGSGGVGVYAVQIARAMGATVSAVASADNQDLMRDLGASDVRDYRAGPYLHQADGFDCILDTVGAVGFAQARPALKAQGVFIPLNFGLKEIGQTLLPTRRDGKVMRIGVSGDKPEDLKTLLDLVQQGQLRPVIDRTYPMDQIVQAHTHVQGRHRKGAVILTMGAAA